MITVKNYLIIGWIRKIITKILLGIYKVIAFINFQLPVLVGAIGLILFLTGVLSNDIYKFLYLGALGLSVLIAIALTARKIVKKLQKKEKPTKKVNETTQPIGESADYSQPAVANEDGATDNAVSGDYETTDKPKLFAVKGRPNYYWSEFPDRYELYFLEKGKLKKIRVDYKKDIV